MLLGALSFPTYLKYQKNTWCYFQNTYNFDLFSEDLPPQLTITVASGHASPGPSGEVLVYPGSIFHIDCLFDRRKGNPDWKTENPVKRYPTGTKSSYLINLGPESLFPE